MTIEPSDFRAFWRAVHHPELSATGEIGPAPFGWQQELVERVCADGHWPKTIDVPTGLGKTTALDIAVFTAAYAAANGLPAMPRRTYMVIDRRVIVDQAFEHAMAIHDALLQPDAGTVIDEVARVIRPQSIERHDLDDGEDAVSKPLVVGRMRGGTTWAWRWLERPDQPAIIIGTVDQLGSRLLFDGYGVGESLRPIDAALTGTDSLVIVDEAHLADAFITTVDEAVRLGRGSESIGRPGAEIVIMSATVRPTEYSTMPDTAGGVAKADTFRFDREAGMGEPVVRQRLAAPKALALAEAKVRNKQRVADTGAVLANAAWILAEEADVVGVVANTVAVARAAFSDLRERLGSEAAHRLVLITGRQREIDREILWDAWRARIEAGRDLQSEPIFVVATQTIEVGADLDFSALVTESASIDAIVQRLGRLNRRGQWSDSRALVVHPSTTDERDPIYGSARQATWQWLTERLSAQELKQKTGGLDFADVLDASPGSLDQLTREAPSELRSRSVRVPVLFPHILDRWVQTSPRPMDAPATGPFLHGIDRDLPTASVVWRHVRKATDIGDDAVVEELIASVELLPVSPPEAVEIPIWSLQEWLNGDREVAADVPDWDAGNHIEIPEPNDRPRWAIAIGPDGAPSVPERRIRPGSTIVVPTWRGGLDAFGWNPESDDAVTDIADLVEHRIAGAGYAKSARRTTLRLGEGILSPFMTKAEREALDELIQDVEAVVEAGDPLGPMAAEVVTRLEALVTDGGSGPAVASIRHGLRRVLKQSLTALRAESGTLRATVPPERDGVRPPALLIHGPGSVEVWSTDATHVGTSISGSPVPLDMHQAAVAQRALTFAEALGLSETLREAVVAAAAHHDVGKLDPRFQIMLNGGYGLPQQPLAKSGVDPSKRWIFGRSRQLAGYPQGMRHEAFSALAVADQFEGHPERDLVVHLVASHHGRARPLAGGVIDPEPVEYEIETERGVTIIDSSAGIDWEQPKRFRELNERFGPWGLALLETIVRLADIGCSAEGS